ncbi:DUF4186 family protein [Streptomyces antibioticus]|uniref:DUF4186 family protein n=1 Tax=Streptomyces antibioticus TaxID=1890 RepID=UPI001FD85F00|nr:DUF4186 family protein [Streptomyces antibioticus]MCX5166535.1 DUF4186 domain-containing protein [Streptomyces antibioticus]
MRPTRPGKDGRQTSWGGDPVFRGQHATATCCRTGRRPGPNTSQPVGNPSGAGGGAVLERATPPRCRRAHPFLAKARVGWAKRTAARPPEQRNVKPGRTRSGLREARPVHRPDR